MQNDDIEKEGMNIFMKNLAPFISCFASFISRTYKDGDYLTVGGKILDHLQFPDIDNKGTQEYILLDDGSENIRAFVYTKFIEDLEIIKPGEVVLISGILSILFDPFEKKEEITITGTKISKLQDVILKNQDIIDQKKVDEAEQEDE